MLICYASTYMQHLKKSNQPCSDWTTTNILPRLKQQNCYLPYVKIYEMLCLMCNITSKITPTNTMPCWVVFFVKFFFDESSNVFFNVEFFQSLLSKVCSILLHLFWHIHIFNNRLFLWHFTALDWHCFDTDCPCGNLLLNLCKNKNTRCCRANLNTFWQMLI